MVRDDDSLKKRMMELSDERLIEILNVDYKEFTIEALAAVEEELKERGHKEALIDKDKQWLSLRDLIFQVKAQDVKDTLIKEFHIDKNDTDKHIKLLYQLQKINPSEENTITIIADRYFDPLSNTFSDLEIYGIEETSVERFNVDLYRWDEWLAFKVDAENIKQVGRNSFVACCLIKMTVYGDSPEVIEERVQILCELQQLDYDDYDAIAIEEEAFEAYPWRRFWARTIDMLLFAVITSPFLIFIPEQMKILIGGIEYILPLSLVVWLFIEAVLISRWGTTVGKALLGIRILETDGNKLTYGRSLNRSASVWYYGLGCGISIVTLITHILSYKRLSEKGITRWDKNGRYSVVHSEVGNVNIIISVLILILIPILRIWIL